MRRKKCVRNIKKALYNMAEEYGGKNMAEQYGRTIWRKNTICEDKIAINTKSE